MECGCQFEEGKEALHRILPWRDEPCLEEDETCMMAQQTLDDVFRLFHREDVQMADILKENERLRVIVCDNNPVGYLKTKLPHTDIGGSSGVHIEELFIMPEFRGRGYGKCIVDKVFEDPGVSFISGSVLEQSVDFWKALGAYLSPIEVLGKRGMILKKGAV